MPIALTLAAALALGIGLAYKLSPLMRVAAELRMERFKPMP